MATIKRERSPLEVDAPQARYFVGIGAQKSGSTWLASSLFDRADVVANPIKEMHVFDSLFVPHLTLDSTAAVRRRLRILEQRIAERGDSAEVARSLQHRLAARQEQLEILSAENPASAIRKYVQYFERRSRGTMLFGEVTPAYALLPPAGFEAILEGFPKARMVFIMRDPVDRLISAAGQAIRNVGLDTRELDVSAMVGRLLAKPQHLLRSRYELTLSNLDAAVPTEQVLTLFYEDLFDPTSHTACDQVGAFLGLPDFRPDRQTRVNEGAAAPVPPGLIESTARPFAGTYASIRERFGRLPPGWLDHASMATEHP